MSSTRPSNISNGLRMPSTSSITGSGEAYEQKGMAAEAVAEHARAEMNVGPGGRTSAGDKTTFKDSDWHAYLQIGRIG